MKFNTDSHFVIGRYHIRQNKPCQDHALDTTLEDGKVGIAVVSDGCSSGGHTDIGARVITCSAINALKNGYDPVHDDTPRFIRGAILDRLITARSILSIKNEDMLATCGYILVNNQSGIAHLTGDGCIAIKYRDGSVHIITLDWQNNTPYYLVYAISPEQKSFEDTHVKFSSGSQAMQITDTIMVSPESINTEKMFVPVDYAMKGYIFRLLILDTTESIAIFSDGVQDFQKNETERIPVEKVVHEMMSFKNYTGEFVKRRVSAALKTFAKDNIHPGDDFSMAVVHFDHKETQEP